MRLLKWVYGNSPFLRNGGALSHLKKCELCIPVQNIWIYTIIEDTQSLTRSLFEKDLHLYSFNSVQKCVYFGGFLGDVYFQNLPF